MVSKTNIKDFKFNFSDLGIEDFFFISIKPNGDTNLFSFNIPKLSDIELTKLLTEVFKQEELFISKVLNKEVLKIFYKVIDKNNFFCCRYNFKKSFSIFVFSVSNKQNLDLYLKTQKPFLYKIALFFNNEKQIEEVLNKNDFKIDIAKIKETYIPEFKVNEFWKAIEIKKHPIRHKITDEVVLLSEQQSKIMLGLSKNFTYDEIYSKYGIKPKTSEYYLQLIKSKTGYSKRIELVCSFLDSNPWLKLNNN